MGWEFSGRQMDDCADGESLLAASLVPHRLPCAVLCLRILRGVSCLERRLSLWDLGWSVGADAADLQWSPDSAVTPGGGGTGTWNTAAPPPWFNGASFQTWSNAAVDNAVFGGTTAGTVSLGGAITAHNLTFNTSGYLRGRRRRQHPDAGRCHSHH